MAELLDTSVLIDLNEESVANALGSELAVSAISIAELTTGVHIAKNPVDRARRLFRLQQVEATFNPIAFDGACAHAFGELTAVVLSQGRTHRRRFADLQIAATARSRGLVLVTRNAKDFKGLEDLITIKAV